MKFIVGDYIFDDEDDFEIVITMKDHSEWYNINDFVINNTNDIIKIRNFNSLIECCYYFKNNQLHDLYKPAMVISFNNKALNMGYYYIRDKKYNYDEWIIKIKNIRRKENIKSILEN